MKILISDFDKTFYTENYDNNIKLINEFVNAGNKFVIATGRPLYFLEPSIEGKNIKCKTKKDIVNTMLDYAIHHMGFMDKTLLSVF